MDRETKQEGKNEIKLFFGAVYVCVRNNNPFALISERRRERERKKPKKKKEKKENRPPISATCGGETRTAAMVGNY